MGEHVIDGEHRKDGKHQPDVLNTLLMILNTLRTTQNMLFFFRLEPDDSKHSILPHLSRRLKKSGHTLLENIILGQLKMGEHQVKCGALLAQL